MFEPGEIAFYRRPEDCKALRCEIISYSAGCYTIRGMRTATCSRRPVLTIEEQHMLPLSVVRPEKKYHREYHGAGLSVPAAESLERKVTVAERLGLDEAQILQARSMLELRRRIVRSLASKNRIDRDDPEHDELFSECVCAMLGAIRVIASKATLEELEAFRSFLQGQGQEQCRAVMNIARTSKTAVIRYLKKRQSYHRLHVNICDLEGRLAA